MPICLAEAEDLIAASGQKQKVRNHMISWFILTRRGLIDRHCKTGPVEREKVAWKTVSTMLSDGSRETGMRNPSERPLLVGTASAKACTQAPRLFVEDLDRS